MKNFILLFSTLFILSQVIAQCDGGCLPEGISFNSQMEIDNFTTQYPDCHKIIGYVSISGLTIENLEGLSNIDSIMGGLSISYCPLLNSFQGLNNLKYVEGHRLDIHDLILPVDLTGFENLNHVTGGLYIYDMDSLTSFNGLSNLNSTGNIYISDNPKLNSFEGLESLSEINGGLIADNNNELTSFSGLQNLTVLHGFLKISNNNSLSSLSSLSQITGDSIQVLQISNNSSLCFCEAEFLASYFQNPQITNIYENGAGCDSPSEIAAINGIQLNGLPMGNYHFYKQKHIDSFHNDYSGCTTLQGNVTISGNDITNLQGLSEISSISQGLEILNSPNLPNLNGLDSLQSIGWWFDIYDNTNLQNINALSNLNHIGGRLNITHNYRLQNINGLSNVETIQGEFHLGVSNFINNLDGISNLEFIGSSVIIGGLPSLNTLVGFPSIENIYGDLIIYDNDLLQDFQGLESINSIEGALKIQENDELNSLSGLGAESFTLYGDIIIDRNFSLPSLQGLESIEWEGYLCWICQNSELKTLDGFSPSDTDWNHFFYITANDVLSICATDYVCEYLESSSGHMHFEYNAYGCNSEYEVEEACETVGNEELNTPDTTLTLYPNPAKETIHIEFSNNDGEDLDAEIININGEIVRTVTISSPFEVVDVANLPKGIYIFRVKQHSGIKPVYFVKQ